jgi:hypothetical protein
MDATEPVVDIDETQIEEQVDTSPEIDLAKAAAFKAQVEAKQNLPLGILGGVVGALVGAAVWAGVTVTTQFQIGWLAVGVGFLAGYSVRMLGKGVSKTFGVVGALCALLGVLTGNLLSICGFYAAEESVSIFPVIVTVLSQPAGWVEMLVATSTPMDILFYGLAVFEGYKFSFRRITEEELGSLAITAESP